MFWTTIRLALRSLAANRLERVVLPLPSMPSKSINTMR